MEPNTGFNKHWRKWFLKDVVKAIETYTMIEQGDHISVALSGGKDSTGLLYILYLLTRYSHLTFSISAVHVKTADYATEQLKDYCSALDIPYFETSLDGDKRDVDGNPCYLCARLKRGAIADLLTAQGITKVAYGHHADDVAETLLMNIALNRKFGSFAPVVAVAGSNMRIIRPLVYLEERTLRQIQSYFRLPLLTYICPYETANVRSVFKQGVKEMDDLFQTRGFSRKVVNSLENIDLTNIWSAMKAT